MTWSVSECYLTFINSMYYKFIILIDFFFIEIFRTKTIFIERVPTTDPAVRQIRQDSFLFRIIISLPSFSSSFSLRVDNLSVLQARLSYIFLGIINYYMTIFTFGRNRAKVDFNVNLSLKHGNVGNVVLTHSLWSVKIENSTTFISHYSATGVDEGRERRVH